MDTSFSEKIVISASRRTDIPAFYMDWFMEGIEKGAFRVQNPISGQVMTVQATPDKVHTIVFWSKNYGPFLESGYGQELVRRGFHLFFHFTINSEDPILEPCIPSLEERLEQAQALSREFGTEAISWRFDPICFYKDKGKDKDTGNGSNRDSDRDRDRDRDILVQEIFFQPAGSRLHSGAGFQPAKTFLDSYRDSDRDSDGGNEGIVYNNLQDLGRIAEAMGRLGVRRCITSFMDDYSKIQKRVRRRPGFTFIYPELQERIEIVSRMQKTLAALSIDLYTCCEKALLSSLPPYSRIKASSCIPNDLLQKLFGGHISLRSDYGQRHRQGCGCKVSRDIGSYRDQPCHHHCLYCYANPASS
jgi:hypothetical protein